MHNKRSSSEAKPETRNPKPETRNICTTALERIVRHFPCIIYIVYCILYCILEFGFTKLLSSSSSSYRLFKQPQHLESAAQRSHNGNVSHQAAAHDLLEEVVEEEKVY